jgi:glycosyltransferase involved in cell wall biosynthesis
VVDREGGRYHAAPVAPALSIVTICLNDRPGLLAALDSVFAQTFRDWELVVVDGGSSDGSVDELRARAGRIASWTSEPDGGIYEAQNKGLARARGDYVLFLNAGDRLASPDALARLLEPRPTEDLVYGDAWFEVNGQLRPWRQPDRLTFEFLMRSSIPHQGTVFRRDLFARLGPHDVSFRIAGDYEFILRAVAAHDATSRHVPCFVAIHNLHGVSGRPESSARVAEERRRAQERNFPRSVLEFHAAYLALRERTLGRRLRAAFRPVTRPLRAFSRRLRNLPEGAR